MFADVYSYENELLYTGRQESIVLKLQEDFITIVNSWASGHADIACLFSFDKPFIANISDTLLFFSIIFTRALLFIHSIIAG